MQRTYSSIPNGEEALRPKEEPQEELETLLAELATSASLELDAETYVSRFNLTGETNSIENKCI